MPRWLSTIPRVLFIALVGLGAILAYGSGRLATLFERDPERRAAAVGRLRGRVLRTTMTLLGATFIKLGQVMSTRPDLFSPPLIAELRKLQDQLPPFAFARVRQTIEAELGGPVERHFAEIEAIPVAAASVAQVHRARLKDGTEVAVKVLRPHVRRTVARDAAILGFFARVAALSPTLRRSDPVGHLHHFIEGIIAQTDLALEARNYEIFHHNFRDFEGLRFPRVYPEASSSRVMTLEFCRGEKIDEMEPGETVPKAAVTIRNAFFKMCFDDGFLHADLHPGNLMVEEDGDVLVLDVGLVLEIDDALLEQFIDFARCISMGVGTDFVRHLKRFHNYMEDVNWDAVGADAEEFVSRFRSQNVTELEWGALINDVFALARRHDIRPVPEMALVLVGVVTAEGIGKQLNPNGNSFQEMAEFLVPILARRGMLQVGTG